MLLLLEWLLLFVAAAVFTGAVAVAFVAVLVFHQRQ